MTLLPPRIHSLEMEEKRSRFEEKIRCKRGAREPQLRNSKPRIAEIDGLDVDANWCASL